MVFTIGFGDITAATEIEMVVATLCMLLGSSLYTYGVSSLSVRIASLDFSRVVTSPYPPI